MSSYNDIGGTLVSRKAEISIKVGTEYYKLDSLQDITINTGMDYEYAKSTAGKIKALPISQFSDFSFKVKRTADFYDLTGNDKKDNIIFSGTVWEKYLLNHLM